MGLCKEAWASSQVGGFNLYIHLFLFERRSSKGGKEEIGRESAIQWFIHHMASVASCGPGHKQETSVVCRVGDTAPAAGIQTGRSDGWLNPLHHNSSPGRVLGVTVFLFSSSLDLAVKY